MKHFRCPAAKGICSFRLHWFDVHSLKLIAELSSSQSTHSERSWVVTTASSCIHAVANWIPTDFMRCHVLMIMSKSRQSQSSTA